MRGRLLCRSLLGCLADHTHPASTPNALEVHWIKTNAWICQPLTIECVPQRITYVTLSKSDILLQAQPLYMPLSLQFGSWLKLPRIHFSCRQRCNFATKHNKLIFQMAHTLLQVSCSSLDSPRTFPRILTIRQYCSRVLILKRLEENEWSPFRHIVRVTSFDSAMWTYIVERHICSYLNVDNEQSWRRTVSHSDK